MKLQLLKEPRELKPWVDVDATAAKFGYDPRWFKPSSFRVVVCRCTKCGLIRDKNLRDAELNTLCSRCSNTKNANTNLALRSQKVSRRFLGLGPFYGKKHTRKSLRKMSESHKKTVRRGKDSNLYGRMYHSKGAWVECSLGRIWVRSSWEAATVKYLDAKKYRWLYESKAFELADSTYTPDFFLEDLDLYVEVKGYWRDDAKIKFDAFKARYPQINIEVWDKPKLRKKGII
jgi:NUMOD3 motif